MKIEQWKTRHLVSCLFAIALVIPIEGQNWLGQIRPAKTNIQEASTILRQAPHRNGTDGLLFKLKEGNVFIDFALGPCISGRWGVWNMKSGTVVHVTFYPKKEKPIQYYKISGHFSKTEEFHGMTYISDEKSGIMYSAVNDKVESISYFVPNGMAMNACE